MTAGSRVFENILQEYLAA